MYKPVIVYGILERNKHWVLSSAYLDNIRLYASELKNGYMINAIYGIPCSLQNNILVAEEKDVIEINKLYEKLVKNGRAVDVGFFTGIQGNFYFTQKEYIPEEEPEDEENKIYESIIFD